MNLFHYKNPSCFCGRKEVGRKREFFYCGLSAKISSYIDKIKESLADLFQSECEGL